MVNLFKIFDDCVFGRLLPVPAPEDFQDMSRLMNDMETDTQFKFVVGRMGVVDTKTSALLTHISLIIAALTFIYSAHSGERWFQLIIIIELSAYLALSVFCLRAIRLTTRLYSNGARLDGVATDAHAFTEEYCKRFEAYNFASNTTILITLVMVLTLFSEGLLSMLR